MALEILPLPYCSLGLIRQSALSAFPQAHRRRAFGTDPVSTAAALHEPPARILQQIRARVQIVAAAADTDTERLFRRGRGFHLATATRGPVAAAAAGGGSAALINSNSAAALIFPFAVRSTTNAA